MQHTTKCQPTPASVLATGCRGPARGARSPELLPLQLHVAGHHVRQLIGRVQGLLGNLLASTASGPCTGATTARRPDGAVGIHEALDLDTAWLRSSQEHYKLVQRQPTRATRVPPEAHGAFPIAPATETMPACAGVSVCAAGEPKGPARRTNQRHVTVAFVGTFTMAVSSIPHTFSQALDLTRMPPCLLLLRLRQQDELAVLPRQQHASTIRTQEAKIALPTAVSWPLAGEASFTITEACNNLLK